MPITMMRGILVPAMAAMVLLSACGADASLESSGARSTSSAGPAEPPVPGPTTFPSPPTIADCLARTRKACYSADLVRKAYGVDALAGAGVTGKGTTIAIFDFSGSPTATKDLEVFSKASGLPAPNITIHQQDLVKGPVAAFDPRNENMLDTAEETSLDLQAAHAMAPDAELVLQQVNLPAEHWKKHRQGHQQSTSSAPADPVSDRLMADEAAIVADAVDEVISETPADVLSISYGYPEVQFGNKDIAALNTYHPVFQQAADKGVTVLASSGDHGAAPPLGPEHSRVRTVQWPSSDPSVLAVGGTRVHLDQAGERTAADEVWDEPGGWAGGGGLSRAFGGAGFQAPIRQITGEHRGVPDLAMSAASDGGLLVYQTMDPANAGWLPIGGTSEAAPLLAGVVALAVQKAGKRLGLVAPAIYRLASQKDPRATGIIDLTRGRNGVDGYEAVAGYDLASGWGTVDASTFVPALAAHAGD